MRIFRFLRRKRRPKSTIEPMPMQFHMLKWHPIFYWAVRQHISDTTTKRIDWA